MNLFLFAGGQGAQGGGLMAYLPFILILAIMYFLMIRPQAKRQKEKQRMLEALKKGDDSLYLCHIIAQGMIKFAIENPQEVFDFGTQQISEAKYKSPSNGEIKRFEEYDNVIDIIDLLSKKNGKLH